MNNDDDEVTIRYFANPFALSGPRKLSLVAVSFAVVIVSWSSASVSGMYKVRLWMRVYYRTKDTVSTVNYFESIDAETISH